MYNDLIDFYESQRDKVQKEINDLWEVGKKSSKKSYILVEIGYILDGLYANKTIKKLEDENQSLRKRLIQEGIEV